MTRAAQMVLTCNLSSGPMLGGNGNWKFSAPMGASAANAANFCASSGVAMCGPLSGAGGGSAGMVCVIVAVAAGVGAAARCGFGCWA